MLLSESINRHAGAREHGVILTEHSLILACDRCGRSTPAGDADLTHLGSDVVYRCPVDNATLARVDARGTYSFHEGSLAVKVATEEIAWWDFIGGVGELAE